RACAAAGGDRVGRREDHPRDVRARVRLRNQGGRRGGGTRRRAGGGGGVSVADVLAAHGLPAADLGEAPSSAKRFADGAAYRVEIPSTEGPRCLEAILEEAARLHVPIHRVSQGSGVDLLARSELEEFAALGREHGVEI